MKERREYQIAWCRIDRAALENLGQFLVVEHARPKGDADLRGTLQFQISCDDRTTYESDALDIIAADSEAILKNPVAASLEYRLYKFGSVMPVEAIAINLHHGNSDYSNRLVVSGNDARWVQSAFTRLKERLDNFPQSDSWFTRHRGWTEFGFLLGLGSVALFALDTGVSLAFGAHVPSANSSPGAKLIIAWFLRILLGMFAWAPLSSAFWDAWPEVELAFGPAHLQRAARRRRSLAYVTTAIVIPLVVTFVYDGATYVADKARRTAPTQSVAPDSTPNHRAPQATQPQRQ